ncbi:hypothetical protein Q3G72_012090 [Acer saccharum]|nr:hypothetical protein Q3G72_012090 [Acer saccharum]
MKIVLKNVRLSFPHLFTPQKQESGQEKYNGSFIIEAGDPQIAAVEKAIAEEAKTKWGMKADAVLKELRAKDKLALHDGDTKSQFEGYSGNMYVSASNAIRPLVLDRDKSPLAEADGKPYSGCYVNVSLEIWAQDNKHGKRVNASLGGVQFVRDGDRFSGGSSADENDFDELGEGADADPLA